MTNISIKAGPYVFEAELEEKKAPKTCEMFLKLLPFKNKVIHSRWSGEAVWIPLGELETGLAFENHTSHPSRGDILFYPGGYSETEILLVYGSSCFASKMGQLAGNHFLSICHGQESLEPLGKLVLWQGAQDIEFSAAAGRERPV
jgi:hypothetical protein